MIDWNRPLRTVGSNRPVRVLATDLPGRFPIAIAALSDQNCSTNVCNDMGFGIFGNNPIVENVPPTKIKVPYVVYRYGGRICTTSEPGHMVFVKSSDGYTVLAEGVMEVEDKS